MIGAISVLDGSELVPDSICWDANALDVDVDRNSDCRAMWRSRKRGGVVKSLVCDMARLIGLQADGGVGEAADKGIGPTTLPVDPAPLWTQRLGLAPEDPLHPIISIRY